MNLCQNNAEKILTPPPSDALAVVEIRKPNRRHLAITESLEEDRERFWLRVNKDGPIPAHRPELGKCWVWIRGKNNKNYGVFTTRGANVAAHRFSFYVANGTLNESLLVCHACDNPSCINPSHLFQGTYKENALDAKEKNRLWFQLDKETVQRSLDKQAISRKRGESNKIARLTDAMVIEARTKFMGNLTNKQIAERLGVGVTTVSEALRGVSWAHLNEQYPPKKS